MTELPQTPWAARFLPLLDRDTIRERSHREAVPLTGLDALPVDTACKLLAKELWPVFYPTTQAVDLLYLLVQRALAHCLQHYPDVEAYVKGLYSKFPPLPEFSPLFCLTGLAGVGKSGVLNALQRILPADSSIELPPDQVFPLRSLWQLDVRIQSSLRDIFAPLGGTDGTLKDRIHSARKRAYRDGIALLPADEFQFLTASAEANTFITQTLLSMGYCGLPAMFIANYSLLHRLLRRPQEDRDRLLSDIIVMYPDSPESEDWAMTLAALLGVAPDVFQIDAQREAPEFYRYCAGIKRAAANLLVVAYRLARTNRPKKRPTVVTLKDIMAAYGSARLAAQREDVELITQQTILNRQASRRRSDLWCPIQDLERTARLSKEMGARREVQVASAIQRAAAPGEERVEHPVLPEGALDNVVGIRRRKRPSAEILKANAASLHDL